jgi:UDP-N-acetylmuramyl pentapeptide phosphotransferase/UDP-N-acetylglucosamine-1-phosphate transferase
MAHISIYLLTFAIPLLIVLLATPIFIRLAPKLGLIDHPIGRHTHDNPTPLGGGIIIFLSLNVTCWLIYNTFWVDFDGRLNLNWWYAFSISSAILVIVGLVDDRFGISPLAKLSGQAVAVLTLYFLSSDKIILAQLDFGLLGTLAFILIWNLIIINAFNLIDGLDGLCTGLALISATGLAIVFILRGTPSDSLICLALIGSCLGFLRYNFHPAKIFLGDTGSMLLGFTLANISLHAGGKGSLFVLLATPFFIAGIPIFDTFLAIWRRSIRKVLKRKENNVTVNVTGGDNDHLHHRLSKLGLKQKHVALCLYTVNALIISVGVLFVISKELSAGLFLVLLVGLTYLLVKHVLHIELWETYKLFTQNKKQPIITHYKLMAFCLFDLFWMVLMQLLSKVITLEGMPQPFAMSKWLVDLPLWITPTFCLLITTHTYIKIWKNSFFNDYFVLVLSILSGCVISLALLFLSKENLGFLLTQQMIIFCFFSLLGLIGIRIPHHILRDWSFSKSNSLAKNRKKVLVYGAGEHGGVFVRELYLKHSHEQGNSCVVGFIDDNVDLHQQHTFGFPVLGGLDSLDKLVEKHQVRKIILTTKISETRFSTLILLCQKMNVDLLVWNSFTYAPQFHCNTNKSGLAS